MVKQWDEAVTHVASCAGPSQLSIGCAPILLTTNPTGTSPPKFSNRFFPVSQQTALKFLIEIGLTWYQIVESIVLASRAGATPRAACHCEMRECSWIFPV